MARPRPKKQMKIKSGETGSTVTAKEGKRVVNRLSRSNNVEADLAPYQKIAERNGMTLPEALRALPRVGMRVGGTYSEPNTYSSVNVSVWIEDTVPGFGAKEQKKHYERLLKRVDYIAGSVLDEAKKTWFDS